MKKNRVRRPIRPIRAVINGVLSAAFAVIILGLLRHAIRDGRAAQVAMGGGVVIVVGALVLWDRWHCRRWPQSTELPAPPMVTEQHESVKDAGGA